MNLGRDLCDVLDDLDEDAERHVLRNDRVFLSSRKQTVDDALQTTDRLHVSLALDAKHVHPEEGHDSQHRTSQSSALFTVY